MKLREIVVCDLLQIRHGKDLSREDLADRTGINRNYIGMLEREQYAATVDMLEKLATILAINPIDLFRQGD